MRQLSAFLAYYGLIMMLLGDNRLIRFPGIAVTTSPFVASGDPLPQPPTSSPATVANDIADDPTSVARQGDPDPAFVGLPSEEGPQLIEFEHGIYLWDRKTAASWEARFVRWAAS
jgi:hypothetical protein